MKKWYKEAYFDRNNWILENFDKLNLDCDETVLLLLLILAQKSNRTVTYDYLLQKMNKTVKQIDQIIASLVDKHYLSLSADKNGLVFDIDEIFEFDPQQYEISENIDLYDTVSQIFGKPLSTTELQKMSDLFYIYGQDRFIEALRIAEAKRIRNLSYIEGILRNDG